jgi:hypothetical protein
MKWGILIAGLVFLLIYWPIGILLMIISLIWWAVDESNKKVGKGDYRKCPFCAESIKAEAKACRYCGKDLPEAPEKITDRDKAAVRLEELKLQFNDLEDGEKKRSIEKEMKALKNQWELW